MQVPKDLLLEAAKVVHKDKKFAVAGAKVEMQEHSAKSYRDLMRVNEESGKK
jgi:hypothetical protein